ncbi:MAG: septum formation initiator family protein [Clostridia bacterium]|nr:septum formation initiator family protein [Clostridia bacterium]
MQKTNLIKIITASAIVFMVLLLVALIINIVKLSNVNAKKAELLAKIEQTQTMIEDNQSTLNYITSQEYIDQYAREYLNMIGKDEEAFTGK